MQITSYIIPNIIFNKNPKADTALSPEPKNLEGCGPKAV